MAYIITYVLDELKITMYRIINYFYLFTTEMKSNLVTNLRDYI